MPVAEIDLSDVADLDGYYNAVNFLKDYEEAKYLKDKGESLGEDDEKV